MVFYWLCESYLSTKVLFIVKNIKITTFGLIFGEISRGFVCVRVVCFSVIYLCVIYCCCGKLTILQIYV